MSGRRPTWVQAKTWRNQIRLCRKGSQPCDPLHRNDDQSDLSDGLGHAMMEERDGAFVIRLTGIRMQTLVQLWAGSQHAKRQHQGGCTGRQ